MPRAGKPRDRVGGSPARFIAPPSRRPFRPASPTRSVSSVALSGLRCEIRDHPGSGRVVLFMATVTWKLEIRRLR